MWEFPKLGVPYFGDLIIRILLFRVLYWGPLFSETPTWGLHRKHFGWEGGVLPRQQKSGFQKFCFGVSAFRIGDPMPYLSDRGGDQSRTSVAFGRKACGQLGRRECGSGLRI